MPVATPEQYWEMLDAAKAGGYAYPAINVTSSQTVNAALQGLAEAGADGIIQVSTGGAEYASGQAVKDMVFGAKAIAAYARVVAERYPILVGLHTDHCPPDKLDHYVRPLLTESRERRSRGEQPIFLSHMFDGSSVPLEENLRIASELLEQCNEADVVLEVECGVVGGEEDGVNTEGTPREKLYTTPEDLLRVAEVLGTGEKGHYIVAATFGNIHGVYKAAAQLRPKVLKAGQDALAEKYGADTQFKYVFHGGSGSSLDDIHEAVDYGVVKMNVDTDMQYAFTRPVAGHMFENYDGVLRVDGGVGNKKAFDPRVWGKKAETGMAERVAQACEELRSAGKSLSARVAV